MAKLAIEELKTALKRLPDWDLAKDREAMNIPSSVIRRRQKRALVAAH